MHTGALPGKLVRNPLTHPKLAGLPDIPAWSMRGVEGTSYLAFASEDGPGAAARPDGEVYAGADGVERAAKAMEAAAAKKREQAAKL